MTVTNTGTAVGRVSAHLRYLLRRADHRGTWARLIDRARGAAPTGEVIHQGAVARVLARHLERTGEVRAGDETARRLKDRVGRALAGTSISRATLELFAGAFDMSEEDRLDLAALWNGSARIFVLDGAEGVPGEVAERLRDPGYRPVSVVEHHVVGSDRCPARHRSMQVLRGTRDDVDRYRYVFDTKCVVVRSDVGCHEIVGPPREILTGVHCVDLMLVEPLDDGAVTTIEYSTSFDYAVTPEPVFRKAVSGRIERITLRIEFTRPAVPREVWWAVWDGLDEPPTSLEPVRLDEQCMAQRYLEEMKDVIAGFTWRW